MPYIAPEAVLEAKQIDLLTYLQTHEPDNLVKLNSTTYCTKEHDSLKISNGKWMWWSRQIGGRNAIDYLIKVKDYDFITAVETVLGSTAVCQPIRQEKPVEKKEQPLVLPEKSSDDEQVRNYLSARGIDWEIIDYCIQEGMIYESLPYHNVVFVGMDENKKPKYAAYRATNEKRIMGDCLGSKKDYSFRITNEESTVVHLFESAIDLLSYATLVKMHGYDWRKENLVSLSGVYAPSENAAEIKLPPAVTKLIGDGSNIKTIFIHFDTDQAGRGAAAALQTALQDRYKVINRPVPYGKDVNDYLCHMRGIDRLKKIRQLKQEKERNSERS